MKKSHVKVYSLASDISSVGIDFSKVKHYLPKDLPNIVKAGIKAFNKKYSK